MTASDAAAAETEGPDPASWASRLIVISVASALFMQNIDATALSTALPTLARSLHTNPVNLRTALTCYIVAQAVFVPASGWAADRFGARRVFMWAMVVFLGGSVMCGLSRALPELVAWRVFQGVGGAMMMPVGRIIVVGAFRREDLVRAMIWLTTPALVGPIVGPLMSGAILAVADWPWIFFINLPVGALGLIGVLRFVPRKKQPHPGPFDFPGFFLSAGAISFTMIGAESIGLLPAWVQIASWATSLALWGAYIRHARRQSRPVLDLSLLRYRTVRASATGAFLFRLSLGATPFLMPLLLQGGLGFTPLQAGAFTMCSAVGAILGRPGAHHVISRLGYRKVMIVSAVSGGILFTAPLLFGRGAPYAAVVVLIALSGLSRAYQLTSVNTVAFAEVPNEAVSRTTSLTSVLQQISLSLGITLGGLLLRLSQTLHPGWPALTPNNFILPFALIGLISTVSPVFYLSLPKDIGRNIAGRGRRG